MLETLITSRVRRKVLALFLLNPEKEFYGREVARRTEENAHAVSVELGRLESSGLLKSRASARLKYYSANKGYPIYEELKRIMIKTEGIGDLLRKGLGAAEELKFAFIYGSFAKGEERAGSDIDLMIVGEIQPSKLNRMIRALERQIGRDVNYSIYPVNEFVARRKEGFIQDILRSKKIMLIGREDELKRLAE